jgi:hypothetical protein
MYISYTIFDYASKQLLLRVAGDVLTRTSTVLVRNRNIAFKSALCG